jgi:hypothetical protein
MSQFEEGFFFGAGFAASQLIFIFIALIIIGVPYLVYIWRLDSRRKKGEDMTGRTGLTHTLKK